MNSSNYIEISINECDGCDSEIPLWVSEQTDYMN